MEPGDEAKQYPAGTLLRHMVLFPQEESKRLTANRFIMLLIAMWQKLNMHFVSVELYSRTTTQYAQRSKCLLISA